MSPGRKSSEFGLIIACGVMILANGTEYVSVPWETIQWFLALTGVYAGARQVVKREDAKVAVASTSERRAP